MRSESLCTWLVCGLLIGLAGCASGRSEFAFEHSERPVRPESKVPELTTAMPKRARRLLVAQQKPSNFSRTRTEVIAGDTTGDAAPRIHNTPAIQPVAHMKRSSSSIGISKKSQPNAPERARQLISDDGDEEFRGSSTPTRLEAMIGGHLASSSRLKVSGPTRTETVQPSAVRTATLRAVTDSFTPATHAEMPAAVESSGDASGKRQPSAASITQLNLPTALSMVGGKHPAVGFAQWRVQEAYAQLDQAKVLWLPSIQPGFSFHRHDGNYQASNGTIVDVNRNSFQYGLGAGATGAGTTQRPGIVAQFHLADAIFQPEIAEKSAWAQGHAAKGVTNKQLLTAALAYLELLKTVQNVRIVEESRGRTEGLSKLTDDFSDAGQGLQADADRLRTELRLVENRLARSQEENEVASARLAQALSIDSRRRIVPLDPTIVPLELVSLELDKSSLIQTGLCNRPELKEAQALVASACEQYKRQKYAPFVPSVLLGFSNGGFGGGLGNNLENIDNRNDFDAMLTWEIRNLGFGEGAARRKTAARIQQARYEKIRVLDQVARDISEAHAQVLHRGRRISITQDAIVSAEHSYERNLDRIRDGQGLPLEVLQSVQALEDAQQAYLAAVIKYNEAQFRLQWALGWPVSDGNAG